MIDPGRPSTKSWYRTPGGTNSQSGAIVIHPEYALISELGRAPARFLKPSRRLMLGSVSVVKSSPHSSLRPNPSASICRCAIATRGTKGSSRSRGRKQGLDRTPEIDLRTNLYVHISLRDVGNFCGGLLKETSQCQSRSKRMPVSRATCCTTAAAAAVSGAEADVPPCKPTATSSADPPSGCESASTLSEGAETSTRVPQPLAKDKPSQRVSANACWARVSHPLAAVQRYRRASCHLRQSPHYRVFLMGLM